jgi:hypothetical protein
VGVFDNERHYNGSTSCAKPLKWQVALCRRGRFLPLTSLTNFSKNTLQTYVPLLNYPQLLFEKWIVYKVVQTNRFARKMLAYRKMARLKCENQAVSLFYDVATKTLFNRGTHGASLVMK